MESKESMGLECRPLILGRSVNYNKLEKTKQWIKNIEILRLLALGTSGNYLEINKL